MAEQRSSSAALWLIVVIALAGAGIFFLYPVYKDLRMRRQELQQAREELAAKREKQMALSKKVRNLQNSPEAVESAARERFGYVRPGENVWHYDEPKKSSSSGSAAPVIR